jgi:acetyl esterase/lipase
VNGVEGDKRFPLNWPKTRISVGLEDPLLDDSLLLMQKMVESKIDCRCVCYEGFSHGFFNTEFIVEESSKTIKDSIKHLE